ncbi:MAG: RNA polymerase sigma factor (sigma-70 family) [Lentisphaeria bacterium]|jgi:RNA polymerase sigma factor (sigma-70 family)
MLRMAKIKQDPTLQSKVAELIPGEKLEALYLQYSNELCRYVVKQFKSNESDAEDVVQQAFVRISKVDLNTIETPRVYMYRIVHNIAVDAYRKLRRFEMVTDQMSADAVDELGPERVADSRQRLKLLAKVIGKMPAKRRELLLMNRFEHLSFAEISRRVGLSESMVRKHVKNALADCHDSLSKLNWGEN